MSKFADGFKDFIAQGNVVDMAIGVIIGTEFAKIVNSLVSDIIMPAVGVFTGGISFSNLSYTLSPAVIENGVVVQEANTINYGMFLDTIISFLIVALCIFTVIYALQNMKQKLMKPAEAEAEPSPSTESLLIEIRDLIDKDRKKLS